MIDGHVPYPGVDNLDVMSNARHYNAHQVDLLLARFGPQERLLDFGAGQGTFARLLRGRGMRVECLEIDARYRERLAADGYVVHAGLEGVADASLDGVYLLNVLEHIEDDVAALREIRTKLRPGGRVFVYVPAFQVLYSTMDRSIGHWRRYTRASLERALLGAGFSLRDARYHDSLGFLAALAYKYVGPRDGRIAPAHVALYDRVVFPPSRAIDRLAGRFLGKNVSATGVRVD